LCILPLLFPNSIPPSLSFHRSSHSFPICVPSVPPFLSLSLSSFSLFLSSPPLSFSLFCPSSFSLCPSNSLSLSLSLSHTHTHTLIQCSLLRDFMDGRELLIP